METLEILAGLTFIYLVLSLVCTAANELVAQLINLRGKTLRTGLRTLIEGHETRSLYGRYIKGSDKSSDSKTTAAPDPDTAWQEVEKAAPAAATAYKTKAQEVSKAIALAESRKARALEAASLAERIRTEAAATEATRAAIDRNS